jgi:hypothetical protein
MKANGCIYDSVDLVVFDLFLYKITIYKHRYIHLDKY